MKPKNLKARIVFVLTSFLMGTAALQSGCVTSSNTPAYDADATATLQQLYAESPVAASLGKQAKGILIFPDILNGGFIIGAHHGNGVLRVNGQTAGYYNTVAASYGLQAGIQRYGFVLFLMNDNAMSYLHASDGWELGVGPTIVIVDQGLAGSLSTTTLRGDVYAFAFNQTGLMGGIGIEGSKITEVTPDE